MAWVGCFTPQLWISSWAPQWLSSNAEINVWRYSMFCLDCRIWTTRLEAIDPFIHSYFTSVVKLSNMQYIVMHYKYWCWQAAGDVAVRISWCWLDDSLPVCSLWSIVCRNCPFSIRWTACQVRYLPVGIIEICCCVVKINIFFKFCTVWAETLLYYKCSVFISYCSMVLISELRCWIVQKVWSALVLMGWLENGQTTVFKVPGLPALWA